MFLYHSILAMFASFLLVTSAVADVKQDISSVSSSQSIAAGKNIPLSSADAANLILINQVSTKDLLKIKGVNPTRARAIAMYRRKYGDFKSVDELAKVKGFNKLALEDLHSIQAQISVR